LTELCNTFQQLLAELYTLKGTNRFAKIIQCAVGARKSGRRWLADKKQETRNKNQDWNNKDASATGGFFYSTL